MKIRPGSISDMPSVLSLIRELAEFEREPEAVVVTVEDLVRDGFSDNPMFFTLVAEIESKVVGMALYYYRYSTWKGKTIHLEDLIVTDAMRGKGVGSALYLEVMRKAISEGVRRVEWNVLDWNIEAVKFYERTGAKILPDWRVVHMDDKGIASFISESNIKTKK